MASEIAERFMRTLQKTEETGDVEPLIELFTDDAELSKLATVEAMQGRDGARHFWCDYLAVFDRIHSEFNHVTESNGTAVLEWTSSGALTSGEPLKYRGVSILEISNGQVHRFRTYYDSAVFLPHGVSDQS